MEQRHTHQQCERVAATGGTFVHRVLVHADAPDNACVANICVAYAAEVGKLGNDNRTES
jgi:hypothetical protein